MGGLPPPRLSAGLVVVTRRAVADSKIAMNTYSYEFDLILEQTHLRAPFGGGHSAFGSPIGPRARDRGTEDRVVTPIIQENLISFLSHDFFD
jgi:hypothetical protein